MKASPSRILSLLAERKLSSVLKINLADPRVIEIAAMSGVDAVWLCMEHVPNDWLGLENQIRAARLHGIDCLVRVARGSYSDYVRPLEAGATGIIVPHVSTVREAQEAVSWVRFNPIGRRPIDGGNIDGRFCMLPVEEYVREGNADRILILQIESPDALENVDEIAAVPGFDGLLFGPGDFSHLIGKVGQVDAPEVVSARRRVAAAAEKHGKFAMAAGLIAPVAELIHEGHKVFGIGADVLGVAEYVQRSLLPLQGLDLTKPVPGADGPRNAHR